MKEEIIKEENNSNKLSLAEKLQQHQNSWTTRVEILSNKMKTIPEMREMCNTIYSERQLCVDYYFTLLNLIAKTNKEYNVKYSKRYIYYKTQSPIKFSSEVAINNQIYSDLAEEKYTLSLLDSHFKFIQETLKSIDSIIYGMNNRIKLEELILNNK